MPVPRTYPPGVPCWIDLETAQPDAAAAFYGGLLGWTLTDAMPPGAPGSYLVATLDGEDVGAIASGAAVAGELGRWNTYIAVDDADATASAVTAAGGTVLAPPADNPGGRFAVCVDPQGAEFRLWQAGRRIGSQAVNRVGGWGFSDLVSPDIASAQAFYTAVFPWVYADLGFGQVFVQVRGYGEHLAAGADPGILDRQREVGASTGFADVVARMRPTRSGEAAHWQVSFGVADRDGAAETASRLGGRVWDRSEVPFQRLAEIADPQGAGVTLSEFVPGGAA